MLSAICNRKIGRIGFCQHYRGDLATSGSGWGIGHARGVGRAEACGMNGRLVGLVRDPTAGRETRR